MDRVVVVPQGTFVPGWQRADKYNLVETDNGFVVGVYERGKLRAQKHASDLGTACRMIAEWTSKEEENERRYRKRASRRGDR